MINEALIKLAGPRFQALLPSDVFKPYDFVYRESTKDKEMIRRILLPPSLTYFEFNYRIKNLMAIVHAIPECDSFIRAIDSRLTYLNEINKGSTKEITNVQPIIKDPEIDLDIVSLVDGFAGRTSAEINLYVQQKDTGFLYFLEVFSLKPRSVVSYFVSDDVSPNILTVDGVNFRLNSEGSSGQWQKVPHTNYEATRILLTEYNYLLSDDNKVLTDNMFIPLIIPGAVIDASWFIDVTRHPDVDLDKLSSELRKVKIETDGLLNNLVNSTLIHEQIAGYILYVIT